MWQKVMHHVGVVLLMVCSQPGSALAQALSPVDQAAQSGLPLLTEFTLRPGEREPFAYRYKAAVDGPHRMTAAWGTVVPMAMGVTGAGGVSVVQQGNPVIVDFEAAKGTEYTIAVRPVGDLPVTSVGQLHGGPRAQATPGVAPGPVLPTGQPPIQMAPKLMAADAARVAVSPQALAATTAGVNREMVLQVLTSNLDTRHSLEQAGLTAGLTPMQLISQGTDKLPVAGGGKTVVASPPVTTNAPLLPANLPQSPEGFDWKAGVRLSPLVNGPYYRQGNKAVPLARWFVVGMCDIMDDPLPALVQKGLIALHFGLPGGMPDSLVRLQVDLPQAGATYLVTLHLTDRTGKSLGTWTQPTDPAQPQSRRVLLGAASSTAAGSPMPTLTPLAGEEGGYATIISVPAGAGSEAFELTTLVGWKGGWAMGGPGVWGWPTSVGPDEPLAPALFGGFTIMRL